MDWVNEIIEQIYSGEPELKKLLIKHSMQVKEKAFRIADNAGVTINRETVAAGAMLHDIGIIRCYAPDILCRGGNHYLAHGITGSAMLREIDPSLEVYALICERHTGSGLTAAEIKAAGLPLPERDFLPESIEEKLICLADKFFSKSGKMTEKPLCRIRQSMEKFGSGPLKRFDELCRIFKIALPDGA